MIPLNPQNFAKKINQLIEEVEKIMADQDLHKDYKKFALRMNEFREKCLHFLSISFKDPDNSFKTEFNENIFKLEQIEIYSSNAMVNSMMVSHHLKRMDFAKNLLNKALKTTEFIAEVQNDLPSVSSEEGLFFKGQYYDAIFKLNNLIASAKRGIKLVDNYINVDLINFLSSKQINVDLKIISTNFNISQIRLTLVGFQKQFNRIEIRENNSYHDRFLIIDDTDFYHFGASLKDLGNKTFMFSKINEAKIQNAIKLDFDNSWQNATVLFS